MSVAGVNWENLHLKSIAGSLCVSLLVLQEGEQGANEKRSLNVFSPTPSGNNCSM